MQMDLQSKMLSDIESDDFRDRHCNCRGGECYLDNVCRKSMVVYKINCSRCNKFYIGNTQQKLKTRIQQHCSGVNALLIEDVPSNSFVRHMAEHLKEANEPYSPQRIKGSIKVEILWHGNAIGCMKTFGTLRCRLCMEEKLAILRANWQQPQSLMNSIVEVNEGCKHRTRFHRLRRCADSADDRV